MRCNTASIRYIWGAGLLTGIGLGYVLDSLAGLGFFGMMAGVLVGNTVGMQLQLLHSRKKGR